MDGFLPIFFLLVVLKIPVLGALWLVWWASREPEVEGAAEDSGRRPQTLAPGALGREARTADLPAALRDGGSAPVQRNL